MRIASYKGTRGGLAGLFNIGVRWWRSSAYSHTELVFSDGMCGSVSWMDNGVRLKAIELDPDRWDIVDIGEPVPERDARLWFILNRGRRYNLLLLLAFVLPFLARWAARLGHVCSTGIGEALQLPEAWRLDPALLHNLAVSARQRRPGA